MTSEHTGAVPRRFVTMVLPWIVGACGLLVYLLTINPWISLLSLGTVTRISGWDWRPELGQPLTYALLYPFRWLPESMIPPAINLFSAVCAALVLALLARSVALLRHDLAPDDLLLQDRPASILSTPTAWMPPVLTAMVCGLQLTFWEHATSGSGEMIDLLVFAYVIRCLLEFRIDPDPSWLSRCACVYGAGMANNWAMLGYLPIFLAAILRATGLRAVLDRRFLLRMALWGLAGLSLYLLMPTVDGVSSSGDIGFWTALKLEFKSQTVGLLSLRTPVFEAMATMLLVPLLVLSIRWKSHTVQLGDDTPLGVLLTKATGHVVHGLFLFVPIWIALDPTFSPRHLGQGVPMLTYYYISALVFGYCAGYFLLLKPGGAFKRLAKAPVAGAWVLLFALPLGLAWRNLGQMRITNGPLLHEFVRELYRDLPAGNSVVLSDDPKHLYLLRAELSARHDDPEKDPILLETGSLRSARYHILMAGQFGSRWPVAPPTNRLEVIRPLGMLELISAFAAREPVLYLHPSSGLFFEPFTDQPNGSVHLLVPCQVRDVVGQKLADAVVATNELIWQQRWTNGLMDLARQTKERPRSILEWAGPALRFLRLQTQQNPTAMGIGYAYSKSLDYWGVEMQRLGRWPEAGVWFRRALDLNPDNVAAQINILYNEHYRRGDKTRLDPEAVELQFRDLFARYGGWAEVLGSDGPVDEPTFLSRTGRVMLFSGNTRQAAAAFMRCAELAPDWMPPKLWLARSYLRLWDFAEVVKLTDRIQGSGQHLGAAGLAELLDCRATAMRALGETNEAVACIEDFVSRYGEQSEVVASAADLYAASGQLERELALVEELVKRDPNNPDLLVHKAVTLLRLARYDDAAATLSKALFLSPSDEAALLYRAIAYLGAGQLDASREDYEQLLRATGNSKLALFGLGAIAWRKHETNAAVDYYEQYLSNAIPGSTQFKIASQRLKELTHGKTP
jgi:tetratricopeptide (TPR) repeat protein